MASDQQQIRISCDWLFSLENYFLLSGRIVSFELERLQNTGFQYTELLLSTRYHSAREREDFPLKFTQFNLELIQLPFSLAFHLLT